MNSTSPGNPKSTLCGNLGGSPRRLSRVLCVMAIALLARCHAVVLDTVYAFKGPPDGSIPTALIQARDGALYGTTATGGPGGAGMVFRLGPDGSPLTLASSGFNGGPRSLMQASNGDLYGTSGDVGTINNKGAIFKIGTNGLFTLPVIFYGTNGSFPVGGLVQHTNGRLYGTTYSGGSSNQGTVFQFADDILTILASFNGTNGANPLGWLLQAPDGNLYGTSSGGGAYGKGTVFRISPDGSLMNLISFNGTNGANPWAGLIQAEDGSLYGTTRYGGSAGNGTVFRFTLDGTLTPLASFSGGTVAFQQPFTGLIQDRDGSLYGITTGAVFYQGCLFRVTTNGVLTQVIAIPTPGVALLRASDGNFYATTTNPYGSIIRITHQKITGLQMTNGCALVSVSAIPNQAYVVQAATDLTAGSWQTISTNVAGANGSFQFLDADTTNPPARFYRTLLH